MGYSFNKIEPLEKIEMVAVASQKKYVALKEGSRLYSMGIELFEKIANDAGAIRRIGDKRILVNTDLLNKYIEDMFS